MPDINSASFFSRSLYRHTPGGSTDPTPKYYVDASRPDDTGNGLTAATAWKTLAKVNAMIAARSIVAGDVIAFRRGQVWEETYHKNGTAYCNNVFVDISGTAANPITFCAYGEGAKPQLLGSYDLSSTGDWTQHDGNIWRSANTLDHCGVDTTRNDIGNIVVKIDGVEQSTGRKLLGASNHDALTSQGMFWYDVPNKYLYIYSDGNPADYYDDPFGIKAVKRSRSFYILSGSNYITIRDLDMRYHGECMVHMVSGDGNIDGTTIYNNTMRWCGGCEYIGLNARAGNAIENWCNNSNTTVSYNYIYQVYDAALTVQGQDVGDTVSNVYWHHNTVEAAYYSIEWFSDGAATHTGTRIEDNVMINGGDSFSIVGSGPRDDGGTKPQGFRWIDNPDAAPGTDCSFQRNIINFGSGSDGYVLRVHSATNVAGWTWDYNHYYPDNGANYWSTGAGRSFAAWKTFSGKDANSEIEDV